MSAEKVLLPAFPGNGIVKVTRWHVKLGDRVKSGQLLAEVETDKASMDFESYHNGRVLYLGAKVGQELREGYLLIIIGDKGTDVSAMIRESVETYALNRNTAPSMAGRVAEIKMFAGTKIPHNWQICDGSEMKIKDKEALYEAITNTFGGNGRDTFCLPSIPSPTAGVNYIICTGDQF
ncbi:MAG: biotin/lipoyl-binding protein [Roseivirga sp.]|nr:biotin/lipoyl-binding protein [Roseivirga sp.]